MLYSSVESSEILQIRKIIQNAEIDLGKNGSCLIFKKFIHIYLGKTIKFQSCENVDIQICKHGEDGMTKSKI